MRDPRPAPPVTITGGSEPVVVQPVPHAGPGEDPDPRVARRRRLALVLLGVGLLPALAIAELQDRRAAAEAARIEAAAARAQEQRDRAVVDLSVGIEWSARADYEPGTDAVSFELMLRVSNHGPRPIEILSIERSELQLDESVPVTAGQGSGLTLIGHYACGQSGPSPTLESLPLEVRTEAGLRRIAVPVPASLSDAYRLDDVCDRARQSGPG